MKKYAYFGVFRPSATVLNVTCRGIGAVREDPIKIPFNYNLSAAHSWYYQAFSVQIFDQRWHECEARTAQLVC